MPPSRDRTYALLDCGLGRRLERFDGVVVDRPAPAADFPPGLPPDAWAAAALRFDRADAAPARGSAAPNAGRGGWSGPPPDDWRVRAPGWPDGLALGLKPADGGQLGAFPEQWPVASALARALSAGPSAPRSRDDSSTADATPPPAGWRVLNLFAYTGAATLAALATGRARVTHVDASRAAVAWARDNAGRSGLADRPARWIVDDALAFVRRERRRGRAYDAIYADPPSFGRTPRGKSGGKGHGTGEWRFARDFAPLLEECAALLAPGAVFFGVCRHTAGAAHARAGDDAERVLRAAAPASVRFERRALTLTPESERGNPLPAGFAFWWAAAEWGRNGQG